MTKQNLSNCTFVIIVAALLMSPMLIDNPFVTAFALVIMFLVITFLQCITGIIGIKCFKNNVLRIILYLLPSILFFSYFVWTESYWTAARHFFRSEIMHPVPESVKKLTIYKWAFVRDSGTMLFFEISPDDLKKIIQVKNLAGPIVSTNLNKYIPSWVQSRLKRKKFPPINSITKPWMYAYEREEGFGKVFVDQKYTSVYWIKYNK